MWIFAPFGLIMPAIRRPERVPEGDTRTIQIRARRKVDIERFRDEFMAPDTVGEIIATPTFDYNFRAYCTPEDFAAGVAKLMLTIDYEKFKPTAERYEGNKSYHDVLNSIWGTVCRLNQPWQGLPPLVAPYKPKGTFGGYVSKYPWSAKAPKSLGERLDEELPESHLESGWDPSGDSAEVLDWLTTDYTQGIRQYDPRELEQLTDADYAEFAALADLPARPGRANRRRLRRARRRAESASV